MSDQLERAQRRLARADTYVRLTKGAFAVYMVLVTALLAFQLYDVQRGQAEQLRTAQESLEKSIADNAKQHERTQEYIRCVASTLLVPLAQRSEQVFDRCGIKADAPSAGTSASPTAQTAPTPTPPTTTKSSPPQTTSTPPEPEVPAAETGEPSLLDRVTDIVLSPLELILGRR